MRWIGRLTQSDGKSKQTFHRREPIGANRLWKSSVVLAHCNFSSNCDRCSHVEYGVASGEMPCKVYLKRFLGELSKNFANKLSDFRRLFLLDRILVFRCESNCGKACSIKPNPASDFPEKLAFAWNARCTFNGLADGFFTLNGSVFRLFPFPNC